jgi:tetratricopeptide (TPR) repeat protein
MRAARSSRGGLALATLLMLAMSAPAAAEDKKAAREAFKEGVRYYDLADFPNALEAFKRAYFNYEEPTFLFNIAQCHRQLGNKPEALRFYRTYLRKSPDAPNAAEVKTIIEGLERGIEEDKRVQALPPPQPLAAPPQSAAPGPNAPAEAVTPPRAVAPATATPVYKKWWLWTVVGVVVVGAGLGLGLGLGLKGETEPSLAPVHFP